MESRTDHRPGAEGAVDGDLVVLDLLCRGDHGDVADAGLCCIFDVVLGFGDEGGDGLAGAGAVVASGIAKEVLDLDNVLLGLGEMVAEGRGELRVGGLFDHGGKSFGDLLLHVERLPEAGDVESSEVFDVFRK